MKMGSLDKISEDLLYGGISEYHTYRNKYVFRMDTRRVKTMEDGGEYASLRISRNGFGIGKFIFEPKTLMDSSMMDSDNSVGDFVFSGRADVNPFTYGPAIKVKDEYRGSGIGRTLLSVGINISREKCKTETQKSHYFTLYRILPGGRPFFRNFGFTIYWNSGTIGKINTDQQELPGLMLE